MCFLNYFCSYIAGVAAIIMYILGLSGVVQECESKLVTPLFPKPD